MLTVFRVLSEGKRLVVFQDPLGERRYAARLDTIGELVVFDAPGLLAGMWNSGG
jgi:hypothetical protein